MLPVGRTARVLGATSAKLCTTQSIHESTLHITLYDRWGDAYMFPVPLGAATVVEVIHELAMMRKGLCAVRCYACVPEIFCTSRENVCVRCRR